MNARIIDADKCIGCGKCVADCICNYLALSEIWGGGKHKASCRERGRCIDCGHCTAICPQGAIIGGKAIYQIEDSDALLDVMASKRSVRHYVKDAVIESSVLNKIILAGQSAPTEKNRKSVRILMIKEALPLVYNKALDYLVEEVKKTGPINPLYTPTLEMDAHRDEVLWNAEYLVVLVGLPARVAEAPMASERMQLVASQYQVGSVYRGDMKEAINHAAELREFLQIKDNEEALIAFSLGMTDLTYRLPAVKLNRPVSFL
jgi:ferredoxin